jgi:hypothetical protein
MRGGSSIDEGSNMNEEDEEIIALMSEFTHPKLDAILNDVQAGRLSVGAALEAIKAACAADPAFDRAMVARVIVDIFRRPEIGHEGQVYSDSELLVRLAEIAKQTKATPRVLNHHHTRHRRSHRADERGLIDEKR